jgi:hypothetical protein
MSPARAATGAVGAAGILGLLACASSSTPVSDDAQACLGLTAPRVLAVSPAPLPASFMSVGLSADVPAEATVSADGTVSEAAVRTTDLALAVLAPFAVETLRRSRFAPGSFEGNPVAIRVPVRVSIGMSRAASGSVELPTQLWAYVAGGESREARWQLRDSVSRLTLVAHIARVGPPGAAIVAVAENGTEKTLLTLPPAASPPEIHQTVETEKFFASAGNYRLELRTSNGASASAHFTIAGDSAHAIVNACRPLVVVKKTGPGY